MSATTRARRPGELEGVHYHFVDDVEFDRLVAEDRLPGVGCGASPCPLRHASRTGRTGPSRPGGRPLLEIDLQGARQVRTTMPGAYFVFLAPPSWPELVSRLVGRGTEGAEERERRLTSAREELAAAPEFDTVVVNHEIPAAAAELVELMRLEH